MIGITAGMVARQLAARESYHRGIDPYDLPALKALAAEMMPTAEIIMAAEVIGAGLGAFNDLMRRIEYPYLTHPTDMALYI